MKLVSSDVNGRILADIVVSDGYDLGSELREYQISYREAKDLQFRIFYTEGLVLLDAHSEITERITTSVHFNSHIVAMVFHLEGAVRVVAADKTYPADAPLHNKVHNIEVVNTNQLDIVYEPGKSVNSFIVLLSREFCLRVMPQEQDLHNNLLKAVGQGERGRLSPEFVSLNQDMVRIIDNVRNCSRKGSFHRLCLEIKIAEMFMLQLEQQQHMHAEQKKRPLFHEVDMEKLDEAKRILDENYVDPPTIKNLALMIGMNPTKLKSAFKQSYNNTIHAYTQKLRMQKAYELLTERNLLLKEVALLVGYHKPSNFTVAFKSFYGIQPGNIGVERENADSLV